MKPYCNASLLDLTVRNIDDVKKIRKKKEQQDYMQAEIRGLVKFTSFGLCSVLMGTRRTS